MIRANDPRLQQITVAEHGFVFPEGSPIPESIPLVGPSSSHPTVEAEGDSSPFEEDFGAFDQVGLSKDPSGDLGDPDLTVADFLLVGTSSQAEMGFKRKPPTSLLDLIEGQPGKDAPGKSQSKPLPPPPQPQPAQTKSSSTQLQPSSPRSRLPPLPQSTMPPRPEPIDPKRKKAAKGKDPVN